MIALMLPSYRRFGDLFKCIANTPVTENVKFIVVANYEDEELAEIERWYGDKTVVVDERPYGKLGVAKAYNLAYQKALDMGCSHVILYADDVQPFDADWLQRLEKYLDIPLGVFSTDECHPGSFGWNIVKDAPIAHFFIMKCGLVPQLFPEEYRQYAIDVDIAVRILKLGHPIVLMPLKMIHWRSHSHREMNDANNEHDNQVFFRFFPEYQPFLNSARLGYVPDQGEPLMINPGVSHD